MTMGTRKDREWDGKPAEQAAVYGNRRRIRVVRGKRLRKQRGEKLERTFAHQRLFRPTMRSTCGLKNGHFHHGLLAFHG